MVSSQHGSDKSTAESHGMPWQLRGHGKAAAGAVLARPVLLGWARMGHGDDTGRKGVCASTWLHGITMVITATTQKTQRETHTPPWASKRYDPPAGWGASAWGTWDRMRTLWHWRRQDERLVAFMLELRTSAGVGVSPCSVDSECVIGQMWRKERWGMEIHSYRSH